MIWLWIPCGSSALGTSDKPTKSWTMLIYANQAIPRNPKQSSHGKNQKLHGLSSVCSGKSVQQESNKNRRWAARPVAWCSSFLLLNFKRPAGWASQLLLSSACRLVHGFWIFWAIFWWPKGSGMHHEKKTRDAGWPSSLH